MSKPQNLNSPFLLGFEAIERALDRVARTGSDGYPPYNIEKLPAEPEIPERLRITLAVAGFAQDHLEITQEDSQLIIRGRRPEEPARHYIHRGIAARAFQRVFLLADGMHVTGANLAHGLLCVDLARPQPDRVVKRIEICARS